MARFASLWNRVYAIKRFRNELPFQKRRCFGLWGVNTCSRSIPWHMESERKESHKIHRTDGNFKAAVPAFLLSRQWRLESLYRNSIDAEVVALMTAWRSVRATFVDWILTAVHLFSKNCKIYFSALLLKRKNSILQE